MASFLQIVNYVLRSVVKHPMKVLVLLLVANGANDSKKRLPHKFSLKIECLENLLLLFDVNNQNVKHVDGERDAVTTSLRNEHFGTKYIHPRLHDNTSHASC